MKEILNPISNVSLKLNLMAMLNDPEFAENLIEHNCFDAVLPYAKVRINEGRGCNCQRRISLCCI